MSLTTGDLKAIKTIVDDAIEDSKLQTAAGFEEVHTKIDGIKTDLSGVKDDLEEVKNYLGEVKNTVGRIELLRRAGITHVDRHGEDIEKLKVKTGII